MDDLPEIFTLLNEKRFDELHEAFKKIDKKRRIKTNFQINWLTIHDGGTQLYVKLYSLRDGKWKFNSYGFVHSDTFIPDDKSKPNIQLSIDNVFPHDDSKNHFFVINNKTEQYLAWNPYSDIILRYLDSIKTRKNNSSLKTEDLQLFIEVNAKKVT